MVFLLHPLNLAATTTKQVNEGFYRYRLLILQRMNISGYSKHYTMSGTSGRDGYANQAKAPFLKLEGQETESARTWMRLTMNPMRSGYATVARSEAFRNE